MAQCDFSIKSHGCNRCTATTLDHRLLEDTLMACKNSTKDYTLRVNYNCPFLTCYKTSQPLVITVQDSLKIVSPLSKICEGETYSCTTDCGIPVQWTIEIKRY